MTNDIHQKIYHLQTQKQRTVRQDNLCERLSKSRVLQTMQKLWKGVGEMKPKLKEMTYADRQRYRYCRRVLNDLRIYGAHYLKEQAESIVKEIEVKYSKELEE